MADVLSTVDNQRCFSSGAKLGRPLKRAEQFLAADLFVNQQGGAFFLIGIR